MGVIGASWRSSILKHWIGDKRVQLTAVADVSEKSLTWFKENVEKNVDTTMDYRELTQRNDLDAIMVMTPDFVHEEQALSALNHGKHVYLEKPMAISIEGCDRLLNAARSTGKSLMVGHNMRYMAMFQVMKRVLEQGEIGDLKAVWVRHFICRGSDYYFHDWHARRQNTTSLLLQKGSHDFDMIHWLTGSYTRKVSGFGGLDYFGGDKPNDLDCRHCDARDHCPEVNVEPRTLCAFRREVDVEDNQVVIMELENGIKASYSQCYFTPDYHRNYTIIGTEGRIENSELDSTVWIKHRKMGTVKSLYDAALTTSDDLDHGDADKKILNDFVEVVLTGKAVSVEPTAARMSVAVGVMAAKSIRMGGALMNIPPVDTGNEAVNSLIRERSHMQSSD